MSDTLLIRKAILHVLDKSTGTPVLSDGLLDLTAAGDYIEKHIIRAGKDDEIKELNLKQMEIDPVVSELLNTYQSSEEAFIAVSKKLAETFFLYINSFDIPSADLLVAEYSLEGRSCLAILKLNYRKNYIHFVSQQEGIFNDIICQPVALPSDSQKVEEFLLFDPFMKSMILKEKKYEINGTADYYISSSILKLQKLRSDKDKLNIVKKTAAKMIEKYYPDDITVTLSVDETISDTYNQDKSVNLGTLATRISKGVSTIHEEFVEELRTSGIEETTLPLNDNLEKRVNQKHKLVTEDGVEVKLPIFLLKRKDKFEIVNNPDGTLSILIKNVELV